MCTYAVFEMCIDTLKESVLENQNSSRGQNFVFKALTYCQLKINYFNCLPNKSYGVGLEWDGV